MSPDTLRRRRALLALGLGLFAIFGVPVSRLLPDLVSPLWLQLAAAAGALFLLVRQFREEPADRRWLLLAALGGLCALLFLGGIAFLFYIWPR